MIAEAFFSVLKREDIPHSYYKDRQKLENAVANYIEFYNFMRPAVFRREFSGETGSDGLECLDSRKQPGFQLARRLF